MSNSDSNERGFAADLELARAAGSEGGSQNTPEQQRARRQNIKKAQKSRLRKNR